MSYVEDFTAQLDDDLRDWGQTVVVSRIGSTTTVTCSGFVRNYTPIELAESSGIIQGDSMIVFSATDLSGFGLRKNDRVLVAGQTRLVMGVENIYIGGVLSRLNVQVRG